MTKAKIPFNFPYMTGNELKYIREAHNNGCLAGNGQFTKRCHQWLESYTGSNKSLLTHSCTAALEMAALLLNIKSGDEIIMPSYTFVSTANAFVLRGAVPVFVDIRADTLNIDESLIEDAITTKTKAIIPVHYAGVACEMDSIMNIAKSNNLYVVEDAAQGIMAKYKGRALGSIGDIGAYSFHETKNLISGEGGSLLVNNSEFISRAEIIWEKGTDRGKYFRGEVNKYSWQAIGSSFLPGELMAAFLWAQLEEAEKITNIRKSKWKRYHDAFEDLEKGGFIIRTVVPEDCQHNGHMYYILLSSDIDRNNILNCFRENNISSVFHYVPLHSSPAGKEYGRSHGSLDVTIEKSKQLIRLPLWVGLTESQQDRVVDVLYKAIGAA